MFRLLSILTTLAVLLASIPHAAAETFKVKFHVTDTDGKPVANAELSNYWVIDPDREIELRPNENSRGLSDTEGNVELQFDDHGREIVVLGYNADRTLSGYCVIDRQKEGSTVEVRFASVSIVTATFICSENNSVPKWTNTMISLKETYCLEHRASNGKISFPFPVGEWSYRTYSEGIIKQIGEFKIVTGEDYPIGELDFELDAMAKLEGKPVPKLDITEARGIDKDFDWADYRGKWVLLEFWGFW